MYPGTPSAATGGPPQAARPQRQKQQRPKPTKKTSPRKGFLITLILVLLVAAAAAVLLLWYLPSRGSNATDSELTARTLVREAMRAIDTVYVETSTFDPQTMAPSALKAVAPAVTFHPVGDTSAATSPNAQAKDNAVNYAGTLTSYAVGTLSEAGTAYGAVVDKTSDSTTYYLGGKPVANWEQTSTTSSTAASGTTPTSQTAQTATETSTSQAGPISMASDVEAMVLLRNAMTTIESAYTSVNTFEPSTMTASLLQQMEPSTTYVIRDTAEAATSPVAFAGDKTVDFYGTATSYAVGTTSESGTTFGVAVDIGAANKTTTYYINGEAEDWSSQLPTSIIGSLEPHRG
jgi:flagellar basal body-associated protein FliL